MKLKTKQQVKSMPVLKENIRIQRYYTGGIYAAAFMLPVLIMLLINWKMGMAPFGERSVLIYDMSNQYVGLFAELHRIVRGDSNIFFSWDKAFGSNFIGVYAYYLSSPFSFLTLLFPVRDLPLALMYLTMLKLGLAGLSIAVYFKHAFGKRGIMTLLFSVCYALMSYNIVYSMNLMWLDGLIWLPMILLGIEKLLQGKKPWLLTASFWVMLIANYYTAYMIGIFSVLYFILRFGGQKRSKAELKYMIRFVIAMLLAAGLAAWLLVPTGINLFSGKLTAGGGGIEGGFYFGPIAMLHKLLPRQYDNIIDVGSFPSIYCGTLPLILSIAYFGLPAIKLREKCLSFLMLAFLTLSFCSKAVNYMWHGFQYPNCFPYRQAFVCSFFIIYLAFRAFCHLPAGPPALKNHRAVYGILCMSALVVLGLQMVELARNGKSMMEHLDEDFRYESLASYQDFYDELIPLVTQTQNETAFFRMEKTFERGKNDAMTFGYKGITHYSSLYNDQLNRFSSQIGLGQGWYWNTYYGNTLLTDMLFGVKYLLSRTPMPDLYQPVDISGSTVLYENPYMLPVGFMAEEVGDLQSHTFDEAGELQDPAGVFHAQNEMLNRVSGLEHRYFKECPVLPVRAEEYVFTVREAGGHYLYIPAGENISRQLYVDDVYHGEYTDADTRRIQYLGDFPEGTPVRLRIEYEEDGAAYRKDPVICLLDTAALEEAFAALEGGGLTVTGYGAGYLEGTVAPAADGTMMTSIPYDAGFRVRVDGEKVVVEKAFETFLCFDVPAGPHRIALYYVPPGLGVGSFISLVSIALTVIFGTGRVRSMNIYR